MIGGNSVRIIASVGNGEVQMTTLPYQAEIVIFAVE